MLWVALLTWVWRGGGATFLGRASSVFMNTAVVDTEYSPTVVRLFVTGLVALSGFGAFVVSQGMPTAVGCAGAG